MAYLATFLRFSHRSVRDCQSAADWCMSDSEQAPAENKDNVLETLTLNATAAAEEYNGLEVYKGLRVKQASDYKALSPEIFKFLKESFALFPHLPRAPTAGEHGFLLTKKANLATELFNDTWTSATLNYAAAAEVYTYVAALVEEGKLDGDSELIKASGGALLASSNVLARSAQFYKHLIKKQANKDAPKPGTERQPILTEADAKGIATALETRQKLERLTNRGRGGRPSRGRGRGRGRRNRRRYYNDYRNREARQNDRKQDANQQRQQK